MILGVALHTMNRILGWVIARDCTCGQRTAPDWYHATTCPHPLKRRARQPTEPFDRVEVTVNGRPL